MDTQINLDAYLNRIQWGGEIKPDLATLAAIVRAHMAHIPFENLDVLLGKPVRLDLDSLQNKLVHARRGGYRFEHSTLLAAVLTRLGFAPQRKLARVTLKAPIDVVPRTHMFLVVPLPEGPFVVDAGFGALAPPFPLPLRDTTPADSEGLSHWMRQDKQYWRMCARSKGEVNEAWGSTLEDEGQGDVDMGNHYVSTHPHSVFVNHILLLALTPEGRVTVMDRDVRIWRDDTAESWQLADQTDLQALLQRYFGIDLPEAAKLRVPTIPEWSRTTPSAK
jgi:N-hydroxyarylamine O-acetyltransferase